ncbi:MAG: hypothetical protein JRG97_02080 [Deltaproteobacteria bacterium]|nr:hypothetical protein [Deltaproteobacteria bacterium]
MSGWTEKIQKAFTAVTFAEANCPDIARQFLKDDPALQSVMVPVRQSNGLNDFLSAVGLGETKVWIGVVDTG